MIVFLSLRAITAFLPLGREVRRSKLHNPELGGGMVVDVSGKAGLLDVKGECSVDVGDWQRDDLQGEHHRSWATVKTVAEL
jgi:hypothetical protein